MSLTEIFGDAGAHSRNHLGNMSEMAHQVMAMNGQSFTTAARLPRQVTVGGA